LLQPGFAPAAVFAANVQGLLLCWYFITSSPELMPNRISDVEDKN
jgi:hypothetical protein